MSPSMNVRKTCRDGHGRLRVTKLRGDHGLWRSTAAPAYVPGVLLLHQLVAGKQGLPLPLPDELLHLLVGQADAVVEVTAPEHIVVRVQQPAL